MNKFQDILSFVRVAELGGFSAAARTLGLTTPSVTKSITRLEENLGVQLLHRTTRIMQLTEYGSEYYERCRQIIFDLQDAENSIREANFTPSGPVRVALPPSFGRLTVIPALNDFYSRYPHIILELCLKAPTNNPIEGGFDLVVHSGRLADSRLVNRVLVRGPQKTVVSPEYIARYGTPNVPSDLKCHQCIIGAFGSNWHFRESKESDEVIRVSGSLITDSGDILREAAIKGIGIAQATWWLFRQEIKRGELISILEDYEVEADPISIVFPANRRTPAKVRAVADFLLEITRR